MTSRIYGQAPETVASTAQLVVAGHLHDLAALEHELHDASEQIALGDKSGLALRHLQAGLRRLHLMVDGMREPVRDLSLPESSRAVPAVADTVATLVDRLRQRCADVRVAGVDARDGDRWDLARVEVRVIVDYMCIDEPRAIRLAVATSDTTLTLTADVSPGLHSFRRQNQQRLKPPLPSREESRRGGGAHIEIDFPLRRP